MKSTLNLKKRKLIGKREVIIMVTAVVLTTAGIKASDSYFNNEVKTRGSDGCPAEMVFVPSAEGGFCIDRYEASPGNECPYQVPSSQPETRTNLDYSECIPDSTEGAVPWRNISQDQAQRACAKAGKRLPTNQEWYLAALGTPDPPSEWGPEDCQVSNNWNSQPGKTGSGRKCLSSSGAYDMVGNVWEWVDGAITDGTIGEKELPASGFIDSTDGDSFPGLTNPDKPNPNYNNDYFWIKDKGLRGIARGGYWDNQSDAGQYSVYMVIPPSFVGVGIGFRCAK